MTKAFKPFLPRKTKKSQIKTLTLTRQITII